MDELYSYKPKTYQYSSPSFEKSTSDHQIYSGYQGNDALGYQDQRRKEELRFLPHSQGPSDPAIKSWTPKEPYYPSGKESVPRSINIQPCSSPVIEKEEV